MAHGRFPAFPTRAFFFSLSSVAPHARSSDYDRYVPRSSVFGPHSTRAHTGRSRTPFSKTLCRSHVRYDMEMRRNADSGPPANRIAYHVARARRPSLRYDVYVSETYLNSRVSLGSSSRHTLYTYTHTCIIHIYIIIFVFFHRPRFESHVT